MKSKLPLILINLSLISSPLGANAAKIYTCTINGETVYTTKPSKSCHSTDLPPIGNYSSERYIPPQTPEPAPSPSNGGQAVKYKAPVKTVSKPAKSNTPPQQAPVNNSRRSILEAELSNERKALTEAQKMLSQARLAKGGNINHQKNQRIAKQCFGQTAKYPSTAKRIGTYVRPCFQIDRSKDLTEEMMKKQENFWDKLGDLLFAPVDIMFWIKKSMGGISCVPAACISY